MGKPLKTTKPLNIGLAGQPNTGKSTLFNRLTGGRQHVGNWPGKTVERKYGRFIHRDNTIMLVDLPGTYSLSANSAEELITRSQIIANDTDALIVMVDASQLQRSMYLLAEITGIEIPVMVACTMVDVAEKQGKFIGIEQLQEKLGVPVVAINAVKGDGIDDLKARIAPLLEHRSSIFIKGLSEKYRSVIGPSFDALVAALPENGIGRYGRPWLASRLIEEDAGIKDLVESVGGEVEFARIESILSGIQDGALKIANARYAWIENLLSGIVTRVHEEAFNAVRGFDRLATHWLFGKILAVFMVLCGFALSFLLLIPVMLALAAAAKVTIESVNQTMTAFGAPRLINSLVTDALIPGVQISIMMVLYVVVVVFIFSIMEDIGYVARIAYVFDRLMGRLGLNGKSVLPFISSFGCNIAGVAGSRVIDNEAQRKATIVISLAVPCLGCWGVISLVASIFFRADALWVISSLFLATSLHMAFTAWLFRDKSTSRKEAPGLIMELPPYHRPGWKAIFQFMISRLRNTARKGGTAIFTAILLIWALTYSSTGSVSDGLLYRFGKALEPVTMLIGLDWRLFLSLIVSAFAKEAALGAITIFFGLNSLETSFGALMTSPVVYDANALGTVIGTTISKPSALAFVFAFYFSVPCMATIATIRSETHSTRFSVIVAGYYMLMALVIAGIVYRIGMLVF